MKRSTLAFAVTAAWLLAGALWGAQTALGSAVSGGMRIPIGSAVRDALVQTLPWIPVTLAVIALTVRFPLTRERWKQSIVVHLLGAPLLAFAANVLVVAGYWVRKGMFGGLVLLVQQGALWATVNFHIALVIYVAILLITQGVQQYRAARERELHFARLEGQLARAHMQALNAQIRPHFLFNTLHTIGQMWRSGRSDEADAVLDRLGNLFHRVQHATSEFEVPLREELDVVREYLAIEQARFRDRLQCTISAEPETLEWMVPPLILQPIVENAIRHGISALSTASTVQVTAAPHDGGLLLTVCDDGPGLHSASAQPGSGTGLRNTRERLDQLYGVGAQITVGDAAGGGTMVRIHIPRASAERVLVSGKYRAPARAAVAV